MADRTDGDGNEAYVKIQTNTDSIANLDTMFEKMINNQYKNLEIVIEDPFPRLKRQNMRCVEMSLLDTFYGEDYIDFKNYSRYILEAKYTNVAAKYKLVSDEKESYSWTKKLATLEEKNNSLSK